MAEPDPQEELPPFRWNWQAMVISVLTAIMLVLPIAGVAYFLQGYLLAPERSSQPKPVPVIDAAPLATALENAAEARLGGDHVKLDAESELELVLPADQISPRLERIVSQAREAGGSALELPSENGDTRRLVVAVPGSRRPLLRRAINGEKIDFSAEPASGNSEILNVTLTPQP